MQMLTYGGRSTRNHRRSDELLALQDVLYCGINFGMQVRRGGPARARQRAPCKRAAAGARTRARAL